MSMPTRLVSYSTSHFAEITDYPVPDVDQDDAFSELFAKSREFTMTSKEVMHSLHSAARYVSERGIEGDFVECGVWRGGSALLAGLTFKASGEKVPRKLWLYDTFEGMTAPTDIDIDLDGNSASALMSAYADEGHWCYAGLGEVENLFKKHGFADDEVNFVKGDVCSTLMSSVPDRISLLRLDTDWYESTMMELEILYPRLVPGGVLIIDDYGHWKGSRRAVDEYFAKVPPLFLQRTSPAVRTGVKV